MPPKRSRKRRASPSPSFPAARKSRETLEAFRLFALPQSTLLSQAQDEDDEAAAAELEDHTEDDNGLIRVLNVRRALKSLNLPPPPADFFDEGQNYLSFENFRELAGTMGELERDEERQQAEEMDVDDEAPARSKGKGKGDAKQQAPKVSKAEKERAEIDHAFALFTTPIPTSGKFEPGSQEGKKITLADLKRVARELREEVDESVLKMMVLEANGLEGNVGVGGGVGMEEFEGVMRRAGVFA